MKKSSRKLKKKFKIMIILIAIFLISIAIFLGIFAYFKSPVSNAYEEKSIIIENGATVSDIANNLKKENIIKNEIFFKLYLKIKNVSNIYAAKYYFSPSMTLDEVVETLNEGGHSVNEITITFAEGINIRDLARIIASNTSNSEDDVYNKLKDKKYIASLIDSYWFLTDAIKNKDIYYPLEGYLFPDTYRFGSKDVSVEEIFETMLNQMGKVLNNYKKELEESDYSIHEIMTLSSITQSEGYNEDDFNNIASVFYNRLKSNMPLGSCVTSYYGVKKSMTDELLLSDINASNPYNTRGANPVKFPAGPISLPGIKAIKAVIFPIDTDYYFFVSDKNNKLYFTKTNSEHEKMISKLQNEGLWLEW